MKRVNPVKILLVSLTLFLIYPKDALAYIDPGTGSLLISVLISIFVGITVFFKTLKLRIKNFFNRTSETNNIDQTETHDD